MMNDYDYDKGFTFCILLGWGWVRFNMKSMGLDVSNLWWMSSYNNIRLSLQDFKDAI